MVTGGLVASHHGDRASSSTVGGGRSSKKAALRTDPDQQEVRPSVDGTPRGGGGPSRAQAYGAGEADGLGDAPSGVAGVGEGVGLGVGTGVWRGPVPAG